MYNGTLEHRPFKDQTQEKPKAYLVYDIEKCRTKIRGYWQSGGRLYKDNIKQVNVSTWRLAILRAKAICNDKKQACVMIKGQKRSYLIDGVGKVLRTFSAKRYINIHSKDQIKGLIKYYGGLTIYRKPKGLLGEVLL